MRRITHDVLKDISPFADVRLEPLMRADGKAVEHNVVVLDPGGANVEVGIVSPGYQLFPNTMAIQVANDILTRTKLNFNSDRQAWDGKRFRQRFIIPSLVMEAKPDDFVALGLDMVNSYDGSTLLGFDFMAQRLKCRNGYKIDHILGGFRFRHVNGNGDFQKELDTAADLITDLTTQTHRILPALQAMTQANIDLMEAKQLFAQADPTGAMHGDALKVLEEPTEWGIFNAFTNVTSERNTVAADRANRAICKFFIDRHIN